MSITLGIIMITVLVSLTAFSERSITHALLFDPIAIRQRSQWYRFFTSGLIHADTEHLLFNMLSLYLFGQTVESGYRQAVLFSNDGALYFGMLYTLGLFFSMVPAYWQHRHNRHYRSLGASGAVSAVVFTGILLDPTAKLGFFLIPPIIPGYLFGPLYLLLSLALEKRGKDNINHGAHVAGAIAGLVFTIVASKWMHTRYDPLQQFFLKVGASF